MKKLAVVALFLVLLLVPAFPTFAQDINLCPPGDFSPICASSADASTIIKTVVQLLLIAAVVVALVFLIWGGIKWITSGGDKAKVEGARNTVIGAVIGLVVAFAAFIILSIVASLFGIEGGIFDLELPSFTGSGADITGANQMIDCEANGGTWNIRANRCE